MIYTGCLELSAVKRQLKTVVDSCYYEGALKITRPVYMESQSPSIYLIHVGGGYLDGDTYFIDLNLDEQAHLSVTTQSSTKVYRTPNQPVKQITNIKLKKGSLLEFFPDSLIAYEGAKFVQDTNVHMEEGASLFYSDMITPGWAADGSLFQYGWIRAKLKIYQNGKLVLFDHLHLEHDKEPFGILKMDGYTHIGSLFMINQQINKEFIDDLYESLEKFNLEARIGLSSLPFDGIILRILANNTGTIEKIFRSAHDFSRKILLNKEPVEWRKF